MASLIEETVEGSDENTEYFSDTQEQDNSDFEVDLRPLDAEYECNAEIQERFSDQHTGEGSFAYI